MSNALPHGHFDPPLRAKRLRVYIGESDKVGGTPLYEAIVREARQLHLAGATVVRSPMGFGANSRIHTVKILRLSQDLPFVVEIIDNQDNVAKILPFLKTHVRGGLVTLEDVDVLQYHAQSAPAGASH
jgi:PII-like signaling protein